MCQANFSVLMQPRMTLTPCFSCLYLWIVEMTGVCWASLIFCDFFVQFSNYHGLLTSTNLQAKLNLTKSINEKKKTKAHWYRFNNKHPAIYTAHRCLISGPLNFKFQHKSSHLFLVLISHVKLESFAMFLLVVPWQVLGVCVLDPLSRAGYPSCHFGLQTSITAACAGVSAPLGHITWLLLACVSLLWPSGLMTVNPGSLLVHDL